MEIRRAEAADVAAITEIVRGSYEPYLDRGLRRPRPLDDDYSARVREGHTYVAVDAAGRIMGTLGVLPMPGGPASGPATSRPAPDHLLIVNVAVDPSRRGEGIGRLLLEHAEALAAAQGLTELRLYTQAAMTENVAMYPRLGWTETGRRTDDGLERVFFSKWLR
jgi:GNAT superfamily N-acetyltransferase